MIGGRLALAGEALGRPSEPRGLSGDSGIAVLRHSSIGGRYKKRDFPNFFGDKPLIFPKIAKQKFGNTNFCKS